MTHHFSPRRSLASDFDFVDYLRTLNRPVSLWEAVRESNPKAKREEVALLVENINESIGIFILTLDDKLS